MTEIAFRFQHSECGTLDLHHRSPWQVSLPPRWPFHRPLSPQGLEGSLRIERRHQCGKLCVSRRLAPGEGNPSRCLTESYGISSPYTLPSLTPLQPPHWSSDRSWIRTSAPTVPSPWDTLPPALSLAHSLTSLHKCQLTRETALTPVCNTVTPANQHQHTLLLLFSFQYHLSPPNVLSYLLTYCVYWWISLLEYKFFEDRDLCFVHWCVPRT